MAFLMSVNPTMAPLMALVTGRPAAAEPPTETQPPMWIMGLAGAVQSVACVLLVMFLTGRLGCEKYVYNVLWMTVLSWAVALAWFMGTQV